MSRHTPLPGLETDAATSPAEGDAPDALNPHERA